MEDEGWRVSYPHKRSYNENAPDAPYDGSIWVEKPVPTWPQDWFDTGYVTIKSSE